MPLVPHRRNGQQLTPEERDKVVEYVYEMDRKGYGPSAIARAVGISRQTVHAYLREAEDKRKQERLTSSATEDAIRKKVEEYRMVRQAAWEAWEKSQQEGLKVVEEIWTSTDPEEPEKLKTITTKVQRTGSNEYLSTVLKALDAERDLLGLSAPKEVNLNHAVIDWDQMYVRSQHQPPKQVQSSSSTPQLQAPSTPDPIETIILQTINPPPPKPDEAT